MAKFKIEINVTKKGLRKEKVHEVVGMAIALLRERLGDAMPSVSIKKINEAPTMMEQLAEANEAKSLAQSIIEELADKMEERRDNFPENLQGTDKFSDTETAADNLRSAFDDMDNIDLDSIEIPGAF